MSTLSKQIESFFKQDKVLNDVIIQLQNDYYLKLKEENINFTNWVHDNYYAVQDGWFAYYPKSKVILTTEMLHYIYNDLNLRNEPKSRYL